MNSETVCGTIPPTAVPTGNSRTADPTIDLGGAEITDTNTVRIGYARISTRAQDHQSQLDALAAADCREVIVETASTRRDRPKLRATLQRLKPGDTLVIYKPDRIARSMKELLVLLEDELHARQINLHILTGICAGLHKPNGQTIADKMLFMVAAMAAEMERELIQERTLDGLAAAQAQGRKGGRPPAVNPDTLAIALARRARGESVTAIATHLDIGRSTLYRALQAHDTHPNPAGEHTPAEDLDDRFADPVTPTQPVRARITGPGSQIPPDLMRRLQNQHLTARPISPLRWLAPACCQLDA